MKSKNSGIGKEEERHQVYLAQQNLQYFEPLYHRYFEQIFQYLYRRCDDEELTNELTALTFLRAMENIRKYQFRGVPFGAWLYKIATNELYQYFRKQKRTPLYTIEEDLLIELMEEPDNREAQVKYLMAALQQLSTAELNILQLHFLEGHTFKEVAFILEKKESAVKMAAYRALGKLKEKMETKRL